MLIISFLRFYRVRWCWPLANPQVKNRRLSSARTCNCIYHVLHPDWCKTEHAVEQITQLWSLLRQKNHRIEISNNLICDETFQLEDKLQGWGSQYGLSTDVSNRLWYFAKQDALQIVLFVLLCWTRRHERASKNRLHNVFVWIQCVCVPLREVMVVTCVECGPWNNTAL